MNSLGFVLLIYLHIIFFTIIISLQHAAHAQNNNVRILGKQTNEDISQQYYAHLVALILDKSTQQYPRKKLSIIDIKTTQARALNLLKRKTIDISWAGTNQKREEDLLPIRIPLFFGLLGYRVSIIHKDNKENFSSLIDDLPAFKSMTACQGEHWPDSDILENNGYKVNRATHLELMFKMLQHKRCDYFPRAIFEGYGELKIAQETYPDLIIFDDIILHYPFPIYLFINKENQLLAKQVEYGLSLAVNDGSLLNLMKSHSMSNHLFPLNKWLGKKYLFLENNFLPKDTPIENKSLWLKLY